jgi:Cys-tRNA(Pro) deacylase
VVKTLVFEAEAEGGRKKPLLVLMHGDCEVSTRQLARFLGVKTVAPASMAGVEKATGYIPGGVSPFGTRTPLPVYVEETVLALDRLYLNGGKRGFLLEIRPADLLRLLAATAVQVALSSGPS